MREKVRLSAKSEDKKSLSRGARKNGEPRKICGCVFKIVTVVFSAAMISASSSSEGSGVLESPRGH